jgi:hypothetical protein
MKQMGAFSVCQAPKGEGALPTSGPAFFRFAVAHYTSAVQPVLFPAGRIEESHSQVSVLPGSKKTSGGSSGVGVIRKVTPLPAPPVVLPRGVSGFSKTVLAGILSRGWLLA